MYGENKIKPCPFCGAEITKLNFNDNADSCKWGRRLEYRMLKKGERLKKGDEWQIDCDEEWKKIPKQWVDLPIEYPTNTTFGRFKIKVRREDASRHQENK